MHTRLAAMANAAWMTPNLLALMSDAVPCGHVETVFPTPPGLSPFAYTSGPEPQLVPGPNLVNVTPCVAYTELMTVPGVTAAPVGVRSKLMVIAVNPVAVNVTGLPTAPATTARTVFVPGVAPSVQRPRVATPLPSVTTVSVT